MASEQDTTEETWAAYRADLVDSLEWWKNRQAAEKDKIGGYPLPPCEAVRQHDEMFCASCGMRWSVDDDSKPPCIYGRKPE